jgi:hypothetical protein
MHNLYRQFRQLLPEPPLQSGIVIEVGASRVVIALPGGGLIHARGEAALGQTVFVRDGVIEGEAPSLPMEIIDI